MTQIQIWTPAFISISTPAGWEDLGETMDLVLGYVKGMNEECLEQEQDARRAGPMHKSEDPRVDVCVYFVSPHRIKKVDVNFMDELSKHVPVVPVLAKACDPIQIQGLGGGMM